MELFLLIALFFGWVFVSFPNKRAEHLSQNGWCVAALRADMAAHLDICITLILSITAGEIGKS